MNQQSSNSSLLIRALAAPGGAGRLRYHFWDRLGFSEFGEFVARHVSLIELFADYSVKIAGDLSAGGFVKWNSLRVRTAEQNLSGSTTERVSWSVDIRSWTIGGTVSLAFPSLF